VTAEFVAGVVLGAVVVLGLGYPMFASWPVRLHWLLASQAGDPFLGFAPPRPAHARGNG